MKKQLKLFTLLLVPFIAHSQAIFKGNEYQLGLSSYLATYTELPFFLRSNQFGEVPSKSQFLQLSVQIKHEYDSLYNKNKELNSFSFGYGLRPLANVGTTNELILSEAYIKGRFKGLELYAGRRKEIFGLVDTVLTSGSYIWSGNALPMPKVQLHTPNFIPLGKRKTLAVNLGISHGWFGQDSVIQGALLHQKWFYARIGKPDASLQFSFGANHQVMWGGYSELLPDGPRYKTTINGYLAPYPLYSYQYILLPFLQKIKAPDQNKVPSYDSGLAVGNQLGSVDFSFTIKQRWGKLLIYKQTPYDFARSIAHFRNIEDGLHGISLHLNNFKELNRITFEFFNSKSQGRYRFGKEQVGNNGEVDNYFFHGQYQSWSYNKQILGNPFILFEKDGIERFNNRVQYYYLTFQGNLKGIRYLTKQVISKNYGTYGRSIDLTQHSGFVQFSKQFKGIHTFSTDIAWDSGVLYYKNLGLKLAYLVKL